MIKKFKIFESQLDAFVDQDISIDPSEVVPKEKRKYSTRSKPDPDQLDVFDDSDPIPTIEDFKDIIYTSDNYKKIESIVSNLYKNNKNKWVTKMMSDLTDGMMYLSYNDTNDYHDKYDNIKEVDHILGMIIESILELSNSIVEKWGRKDLSGSDYKEHLDPYKRKILKEYLSKLSTGPDLLTTINGWKDFIKVKLESAKYELSFTTGGGFESKQTSLSMGKSYMMDYVLGTDPKYDKKFMIENFTKNVNKLVDEISANNNGTIKKLTKGDLVAKQDIRIKTGRDKDGNSILGDILVHNGDFVEVKNKNYKVPHILSEFYAIGKASKTKNRKSISSIFKSNPDMFAKYQEIIEEFFQLIKPGGDLGDKGEIILEEISKSYAGILFANDIYVPTNGVEIYWHNYGQRQNEKRLSIWHKVKDNTKKYFYSQRNVNDIHFNPFS